MITNQSLILLWCFKAVKLDKCGKYLQMILGWGWGGGNPGSFQPMFQDLCSTGKNRKDKKTKKTAKKGRKLNNIFQCQTS